MNTIEEPKVINQAHGENWTLYHGDSCEVLQAIPKESIGMSIFSPPFMTLYVFSSSLRDVGNCESEEKFFEHYEYLTREVYRVLMPGRICCVDVMQVPKTKEKHGVIGIRDLRGDIIRLCEKVGFIFHSEVAIWLDPVCAMQRSKALGLLHKQILKDSAMCRQGLARFLCIFRKPGENPKPISHHGGRTQVKPDDFSINLWQRYASPIWASMAETRDGFVEFEYPNEHSGDTGGINPGETLTRFRESEEEPHITAMQLPIIERAVRLWSAPGDIVLDPFAGLGSTGYVAVKEGRKSIGIELKESYFRQAVRNMLRAETEANEKLLF